MTLINCKECGKQVSKITAACPECGNPIKKGPGKPIGYATAVVVVVLLFFVVDWFIMTGLYGDGAEQAAPVPVRTTAITPEHRAHCVDIRTLADSLMFARQSGVTRGELKDVIGDRSGWGELMVPAAYEYPIYKTGAYQTEAIREFAEEWQAKCLR